MSSQTVSSLQQKIVESFSSLQSSLVDLAKLDQKALVSMFSPEGICSQTLDKEQLNRLQLLAQHVTEDFDNSSSQILVKVWASQKDWDEGLEPLKTFILDESNKGNLFQTLRDFGFSEDVHLTFRNTRDLIQTN